jgi:hypothetical protein
MWAFGLLMWRGLRKGIPVYQGPAVAEASASVGFDNPSTSAVLISVNAYNRKMGGQPKMLSKRGRRPRKKVDRRVMEAGKATVLVGAWMLHRERDMS